MAVNQQVLNGLNVSYSTAYNKAFSEVSTDYQKIATTIPSSTAETNYKWLGQFPQMREWVGERELQSLAAYEYVIKNRKFEMSVSVPRDDIEDDQYGIYSTYIAGMGQAAAEFPDELVFDAARNGFTGICYDGMPFFSAEHPSGMYGVATSNLSHARLTAESYELARTSMMNLTGDQGQSLNIIPDLLVVSPAEEKAARLILKADQIDGTTNVLKDTAEILVTTRFASKPHMWMLLCTKKPLKPFIFQERKKIKMTALNRDTDENVFMNDTFIWGCDGRSNAGYGFWQMAYGSDGTEEMQG